MILEDGDLRVYYKTSERISMKLDKAISISLKKFGYNEWRSGFDLEDGTRDLIFRKG